MESRVAPSHRRVLAARVHSIHMAAIFSVLLLAHGAAGLAPFLHGSRNGGLSMPTPQSTAVYTPPASPVSKFARRASHVALGWAGSTFLSAQHALAATKDMVARAANKQTLRFPRSRPRRKRWWARAASKQTLKVPPKLV